MPSISDLKKILSSIDKNVIYNIIVIFSIIFLFFIVLSILLKRRKKDFEDKSISEPELRASTSENIINVLRKKLALQAEENRYTQVFIKKIQEFEKNIELYKEYIFPFFHYQFNGTITHFTRFFRNDLPKEIKCQLEELESMWHQGFRDEKLAVYLMFYKASGNFSNTNSFLFQLLGYRKLSKPSRLLLKFYFQDILKESINPNDFEKEIKNEFNLPLSFYFFDKFIIQNKFFDRRLISLGFKNIFKDYANIPENLISFYFKYLNEKCSYFSKLYLIKISPLERNPFWREFYEKQIFLFGKYKYLQYLKDTPQYKELNALYNYESTNLKSIKSFLYGKPFGDIHYISFFIRINSNKLLSFNEKEGSFEFKFDELPKIISEDVLNWISSAKSSEKADNINLPIYVKWTVFLYHIFSGDIIMANKLHPLIGFYRNDLRTKIFYSRYLFFSNQKEKAWEIVDSLIAENKKNLLLLNEAAIYAFFNNDIEKAEEIFQMMKEYYPDHPVTVYNEALFFEKKYKREIADKWKNYVNLA
ncbi:MAG: hypothetical protein OEZ13_02735 [Spirochaetia bacterium]|nr:hypothetical protein [Spirochaetia bacterium]